MAVSGTEGAAGTLEYTFSLRNTTGPPCPMDGFPSLELLGTGGAQLPTHVVQGGTYSFTDYAPDALTLAPGQSAYFNMGFSDVPTGSTSCDSVTQIEIFPPKASDDDVVAAPGLTVCDGGRVTVSPVFGTGGPETTAPPQP